MQILLPILGRFFAIIPTGLLRFFCLSVAFVMVNVPNKRKRVLFSNIHHCFENMPYPEVKATAQKSLARMIELGLFVLASAYFSKKRIRKTIKISDKSLGYLKNFFDNPKPTVLAGAHFCLMESVVMFPLLHDGVTPRCGVFYRPFGSRGLENWVRKTREKYNIELLSRKEGLHQAFNYLRNKSAVAIMFDQNTRSSEILTMFFDMPCTSTELPGVMVEKFKADCYAFYAKRKSFWQAEIIGEKLEFTEADDITLATNLWLENLIKSNPDTCKDWLWAHKRWAGTQYPGRLFSLPQKHSLIDKFCQAKGYSQMPRKFRGIITMPDELYKCILLLPLIRTLRVSRPDAFVTLLCESSVAEYMKILNIADKVIALPAIEKKSERQSEILKLNRSFQDFHLIFTQDSQHDKEAFSIDALRRFGIGSKALFTTKFVAKNATGHYTNLYEALMRSHALKGDLDLSAITPFKVSPTNKVMFFCGNCADEKFFDASKCEEVLKVMRARNSDLEFQIFNFEIYTKFSESDLVKTLLGAALIISVNANVTHLANALGVPTVSISNTKNIEEYAMLYDAPKLHINIDDSDNTPEKIADTALGLIK